MHWVHDHFVKHGVDEPIAQAALKGLSDQQLLEMSQLEVRVLTKLLKSVQKTLDETKTLSKLLPGDAHLSESQRDQLQKASLYLAASMRRSVDLVFDAMEGKVKDRQMWSKAAKNAHGYVMKSVCDNVLNNNPKLCADSKLHVPWHSQKADPADEL